MVGRDTISSNNPLSSALSLYPSTPHYRQVHTVYIYTSRTVLILIRPPPQCRIFFLPPYFFLYLLFHSNNEQTVEIRLVLGSSLISRFHIQYDLLWLAIVFIENESTACKMRSRQQHCSARATTRSGSCCSSGSSPLRLTGRARGRIGDAGWATTANRTRSSLAMGRNGSAAGWG